MPKNAVSVEDLFVEIEDFLILHDIDLDFPKGKVIGILGPSGAGKTTLVRAIVGLQPLASGSISILDRQAGDKSLRHDISYMAQESDVYLDLTVLENLQYFAKIIGAKEKRIAEIINLVDLTPQLQQITSTLSGGQLVRVSLAVALLGSPKVIILDEPTVGLDPVLRQKLWQDFHALTKNGETVIVTSHVMDEANRCDHLVLMRDGGILAADTPENLKKQTKTKDMEQAFLKLIGEAK